MQGTICLRSKNKHATANPLAAQISRKCRLVDFFVILLFVYEISKILLNQNDYYQAINDSTEKSDSGIFVDFMLERILDALKQRQGTKLGGVNDGVNDGVNGGVNEVEMVYAYIRQHPGLRANAIAEALSLPKRTLERHLGQLKKGSRIEFRGAPKTGGYHII